MCVCVCVCTNLVEMRSVPLMGYDASGGGNKLCSNLYIPSFLEWVCDVE